MSIDYDSSLPIRTETEAGDATVKIVDTDGENQWNIDDGNRGKVNVADKDDNELIVNADGSINVNTVSTTVGTEIHWFGTDAETAPNTPKEIVEEIIPVDTVMMIKAISGACAGKARFELKCGTIDSEETKAVAFISTADGSFEYTFPQPIEVVAGDKVLLVAINKDKGNSDTYGFVNGVEVAV